MADQRPPYQFDVEAFRKKYDLCQNVAEAVRAPTLVPAVSHVQAGKEILVGQCPCGALAALSGEGKHLCRHCNTWLQYEKVG